MVVQGCYVLGLRTISSVGIDDRRFFLTSASSKKMHETEQGIIKYYKTLNNRNMDSRITNIGVALPWGSHDCCRCPKMLRTWQSLVPCWLPQKRLMHDCRRMGLCVTASYLMWLLEASKYRRCPYFAGLLRGFFSGSRVGYIGSSSLIPLTAQSDMDAGVCDLRTHR